MPDVVVAIAFSRCRVCSSLYPCREHVKVIDRNGRYSNRAMEKIGQHSGGQHRTTDHGPERTLAEHVWPLEMRQIRFYQWQQYWFSGTPQLLIAFHKYF